MDRTVRTVEDVLALMDGLFQFALLRCLAGETAAADDLDPRLQRALDSFLR